MAFFRRFCQICLELNTPGFTSLDFATIIFSQRKVVDFVSNPQPGEPGLCIYVPQWQDGPVMPPGIGFPFFAFYGSQGNDGIILTSFHAEFLYIQKSKKKKNLVVSKSPIQIFILISRRPCPCYMPRPFNLPWFDYLTDIWWRVQVTRFLIVQFSSASCYFLLLRSKSSPKDFTLKHLQIFCFPYNDKFKFHAHT
jgi:hypothetical protein